MLAPHHERFFSPVRPAVPAIAYVFAKATPHRLATAGGADAIGVSLRKYSG
jgi:hypothetical protein